MAGWNRLSRRGLGVIAARLLVGGAAVAQAQGSPPIAVGPGLAPGASTGFSFERRPASTFDPYTVDVRGMKLGMTRAQVLQVLEQNQMRIGGNYGRDLEAQLGVQLYKIQTLEGDDLEFRLKEYSAGGPYPQFLLNFTYPTPGDPQVLWAFMYQDRFGRDVPIEAVMRRLFDRYGRPDHVDNSTDGLEVFIYYGPLRFNPFFDADARAASGNTGMFVHIIGPRRADRFGVLKIQVGDHQLWTAKFNSLVVYQKSFQEQRTKREDQPEREILGPPKF